MGLASRLFIRPEQGAKLAPAECTTLVCKIQVLFIFKKHFDCLSLQSVHVKVTFHIYAREGVGGGREGGESHGAYLKNFYSYPRYCQGGENS